MVWCLDFGSDFGRFFPQGEFVGFDEALDAFFLEQLPEAERQSFENKSIHYRMDAHLGNRVDVHTKFNANTGRVLDHEWPDECHLSRDYKELGTVFMVRNRILLVSAGLKSVIESLEPDLHQFRTIRLLTRQGDIYPGGYHVMSIQQSLDSFDPEASNKDSLKWSKMRNRYRIRNTLPKVIAGVSSSKEVVQGKHIWRETGALSITPGICLSDQLVTQVRASNLLMPKLLPTKGVAT